MDYLSEHWRACAPTTPSNGSCARFAASPAPSVPSPTDKARSCSSRLRHVAGTKWGVKRYLDMGHLGGHNATEDPARATSSTA